MKNKKNRTFEKTVLVIGSWAKSQITIENIKRSGRFKVCSFLSVNNPGIKRASDAFRMGDLSDVRAISGYAKEIKADLALIMTAVPLKCGLVDKLENIGITAFGPNSEEVRLESDKAFARDLFTEYDINNIPEYGVFDEPKQAMRFAEELKMEVAVKPLGLTDGVGVKVYPDQLASRKETENYISEILKKDKKVLLEEKICGPEFSIQCLVSGNEILTTPVVKDFKKKLDGDKGLNTASMGSYSDKSFLLPFVSEEEYYKAIEIIKKTLKALKDKTGKSAKGFLYGQFMRTDKKIMLVEYNFRPGDPEWMNTLTILENNIADVIFSLLAKKKTRLRFEKKATVCKYIVPKEYPEKPHGTLNVELDQKRLRESSVSYYYSAGMDLSGKLDVGTERGIAFATKRDTIRKAAEAINKAILATKGDFHFRKDIGTKKQLDTLARNNEHDKKYATHQTST